MTKIEKLFSGVQYFDGDVWVADYTNATNSAKGVVIQNCGFDDIASFHLVNRSHINLLAVNFERNKGFFPKGVRNCECMIRPNHVVKGWLLLCELKYCKIANIGGNADEAYRQLIDTWSLLEGNRLYDKKHCKIFLNISIPEQKYSLVPPFLSFIGNQDEQLCFHKKHRIHLIGINNVLALNSGILQIVNE